MTNNGARLLLVPALVFIATAVDRGYQTDFWHHLARGRAMTEQGTWVDHDLFTYTVAGQPFRDANWLTQLVYHQLFSVGGLALVQVVNSLTLACTLGLLVWHCQRQCRSWLLASCVGLVVFAGLWQVCIIRPQTFSFLLFVLLLVVLSASQARPRWLLVPPLLLALWANVHGGFPIGFVLVGSFWLSSVCSVVASYRADSADQQEASLKQFACLTLCLLACLLASCANPYGWKIYQYVQVTAQRAATRRLDEWLPPGTSLLISKVWLGTVLALFVLFASLRRGPSLLEVCLVLCFLPLATGSVRMIAWWLLVTAPLLSRLLADAWADRFRDQETDQAPTLEAACFTGVLLLGSVWSLPWFEKAHPLLQLTKGTHRTETDLAEILTHLPTPLKAAEPVRIFCRFEWGEYVGWAAAGRGTVFMDGRIEIYPDEVWDDYCALTRARADWRSLLAKYRVDVLLLDADFHAELLPVVEQAPDWVCLEKVGKARLYRCRPAE